MKSNTRSRYLWKTKTFFILFVSAKKMFRFIPLQWGVCAQRVFSLTLFTQKFDVRVGSLKTGREEEEVRDSV